MWRSRIAIVWTYSSLTAPSSSLSGGITDSQSSRIHRSESNVARRDRSPRRGVEDPTIDSTDRTPSSLECWRTKRLQAQPSGCTLRFSSQFLGCGRCGRNQRRPIRRTIPSQPRKLERCKHPVLDTRFARSGNATVPRWRCRPWARPQRDEHRDASSRTNASGSALTTLSSSHPSQWAALEPGTPSRVTIFTSPTSRAKSRVADRRNVGLQPSPGYRAVTTEGARIRRIATRNRLQNCRMSWREAGLRSGSVGLNRITERYSAYSEWVLGYILEVHACTGDRGRP